MLDKINISSIVKNHLATLRSAATKKAAFDDYLTFLIIPVAAAALLLLLKIKLSDTAINIIITALSILVGLLFNVVVLIFDIINRDASKKLKNEILKELLYNISFAILLSVISIIVTLFTFIDEPLTKIIFDGIVYFLLSLFILTVLMILKRMYKLFKNEIEEIEKTN